MLKMLNVLKLPLFVIGMILAAHLGGLVFLIYLGGSYMVYVYVRELTKLREEDKKLMRKMGEDDEEN